MSLSIEHADTKAIGGSFSGKRDSFQKRKIGREVARESGERFTMALHDDGGSGVAGGDGDAETQGFI